MDFVLVLRDQLIETAAIFGRCDADQRELTIVTVDRYGQSLRQTVFASLIEDSLLILPQVFPIF